MAEALTFSRDIRDSKGFDTRIAAEGCTPDSKAFASICEMGNFSGRLKPHMGQATLMVHNVVPEEDRVRVRGYIDWGHDLDVRLSVVVFVK